MYDEKAKERTMKYMKEKRDKLTLNLPLGSKERYKKHAESKGKSLTSLFVDLVEDDIKNSGKPAPHTEKQAEQTPPPRPPKAVKPAETMSDEEFLARVNALREYHKSDGETNLEKLEGEETENADT